MRKYVKFQERNKILNKFAEKTGREIMISFFKFWQALKIIAKLGKIFWNIENKINRTNFEVKN